MQGRGGRDRLYNTDAAKLFFAINVRWRYPSGPKNPNGVLKTHPFYAVSNLQHVDCALNIPKNVIYAPPKSVPYRYQVLRMNAVPPLVILKRILGAVVIFQRIL
jgi:hypothetical protein